MTRDEMEARARALLEDDRASWASRNIATLLAPLWDELAAARAQVQCRSCGDRYVSRLSLKY